MEGARRPPHVPPRLARGRTTADVVVLTTAALIHVIVSGVATGCIYALMALSLVIARWSMEGARRPPHVPPGSRVAAPSRTSWS
jgi:hypothetical protein